MQNYKIVKTYSQVLFKLAVESYAEQKIFDHLNLFVSIFHSNSSINELFSSPVILETYKFKIMNDISKKLLLEATFNNFILVLIKNKRFTLLDSITESYKKLLYEKNNIVEAEIISADKASQHEIKIIKKYLEEELNKKIDIKSSIDSSLLGGAMIKYHALLIDCTIAGALKKVKNNAMLINTI